LARTAGFVPPIVVKPNARGSSVGTRIVRRVEELGPAAAEALALDEAAILEAFAPGRELTAGFVGPRALPLVELRTHREFYDYAAKYEDGETGYVCPAELAEATAESVRALGRRAAEALGVTGLGRTDIILTGEGPTILEVNTIPGFTTHSLLPMAARAAGMAMPDLCRTLLEAALGVSAREGA
jgi:D-alanine-D-alanine ligase